MSARQKMTLQQLAASALRKQLRKLSREADRVCSGDNIEALHQVRVVVRRLRSALTVFAGCFPEKQRRSWRKALRRLTRGLGRPRDLDVQIALVHGILDKCGDAALRPGIDRLLLRLRQRRAGLSGRMERALARFAQDRVNDQMLAAAETLAARRAPSAAASPDPRAACRGAILGALADLAAYRQCLLNPDDAQRHHAMRIRAKRLRYALEVCSEAYGRRLKPMIDAARTLQTLLGDLHDGDLWLSDLAAFEAAERQRTKEYFGHDRPFARLKPGLDHLAADRRQRRDQIFHALGAAWRAIEQRGVWTKLAALLD